MLNVLTTKINKIPSFSLFSSSFIKQISHFILSLPLTPCPSIEPPIWRRSGAVSMLRRLKTGQGCPFVILRVLVCQRELASIFLCCALPCMTRQAQRHTDQSKGRSKKRQTKWRKRGEEEGGWRKGSEIYLIPQFGPTGLEVESKRVNKRQSTRHRSKLYQCILCENYNGALIDLRKLPLYFAVDMRDTRLHTHAQDYSLHSCTSASAGRVGLDAFSCSYIT